MQRSVLIIEDSPDHADLFAALLGQIVSPPWRVRAVGSMGAAVELLQGEEYDAALVDLRLPDSAGAPTIEALTSRFPHLPIVGLSAHVDDDLEDAVIAAGADDLLPKSRANGETLVRALRRAIRRKEPARQLAQSERRFEAVFRKSPMPMLVTRETGEILDVNEAFVETFGFAREAALGRTGVEIGMWMDASERSAVVDALREPGAGPTREIRIRAADGRVLSGLASNQLIELDGEPCILGTFLDITARKKGEVLLAESRARFETLFRSSPAPTLITTAEGEVVDANDAAGEFFRRPWEELGRLTAADLGLWAGGGPVCGVDSQRKEVSLSTPADGSRVAVVSCERVQVRGEPRLLFALQDLTDRVEAERSLRASEARYRALLEGGWTALTVTDRDGVLTYASPRCLEILGYRPDELVGRGVTEMMGATVNPEDRERTTQAYIDGVTRKAATWSGYFRAITPGGEERAFEYSAVNRLADPEVQGLVVTYRDITEIRAAEDALRASESLFKGVFDRALEAMVIADDEGVYLEVNPAACELYRLPPEELRGRSGAEFTPPDVDFKTVWGTLLEQGAMEGEFRLKLTDGTFRYVQFGSRANVLPGRHFSAMRDVTAEKAADEALRLSEERYRGLFERSRAAVYQRDLDGRLLDCNPAFLQMFGFEDRESVIGSRTAPLWVDPEQEREFIGLLQRHGEVTGHLVSARTLDGRILELVTNARLDSSGVIEGNAIDITAEVHASREAERQRVFLDSVLQAIPAMVARFDAAGTLEYVNRAWEQTIGWSVEDARRVDVMTELYPDPTERRRAWEWVRSATGQWGDFRTTNRQGKVLDTTWANVAQPDGGTVGIGQDVTERRNLEAQLRQAQKMEALGRLAGGVAHDFNNVLTAILGYSEMMQRKLPPDSPFLRNVGEIRRAGERAAALVRQLLAFSRNQPLDKRVLSLKRVIEDVAPMLRRVIGEHIELQLALAPADDNVLADQSQLEQVILNLAVNGRDAMPEGGRLAVTSRIERGPGGRSAVIEFRDTGPGIPPEALGRLFEPFFTTKSAGQGTGLGLATVFGIMAQLDGTVTADNPEGGGARFTLVLPLVPETAAEGNAVEIPAATPRGHETILLVEDEDTVRSLAREVLEVHGYQVMQAAHPRAALQIAESGIPIDLVLTDVLMPEMTGPALVARLRRQAPGLRALFMSGYTAEAFVADPGRPDQLLQKPFSAEALVRGVRAALDA